MQRQSDRGCKPRALAAAIGLALAASGAHAATFDITSNADAGPGTLRQAIVDANTLAGPHILDFSAISGQTITLAGDLPGITEGMALQGSEVTLSGDDNYSCLDAGGVRLAAERMTITGCSSLGYGGGVFLIDGELDLKGVTITNSTAGGGGGVAAVFSEVTIADSTISGNEAGSDGGGVYLYDSRMMLTDSTISGNTGNGRGNAIFGYYAADATIIGSTISDNYSADPGAAIYLEDARLRLFNSAVTGNSTDAGVGSGIFAQATDALIVGSTVADNTAPGGGLGLGFFYSEAATIVNSTISGNDAGGVFAHETTLTVIDSTVSGNGRESAEAFGGILALESESVISGSTIADNQAFDNSAGGINLDRGWALVEESVISGNEGAHAGGLYADYADLYLLDTQVVDNQGSDGQGGLYLFTGGFLNISGSTISGNNGSQYEGGGVVWARGQADVLIRNTTVSGNQAANYSGGLALYVDGQAQALLDGVTVTGNEAHAGDYGGLAVFSPPGGQTRVRNSIIAGNTASGSRLNLSGEGADISYTLIGDPTVSSDFTPDAATLSLLGQDPMLGPLADNGGFTLTHLPGETGAGLNIIPVGTSGCGDVFGIDQRGQPRPGANSSACDLGSVERDGPPPPDEVFADRFEVE